MSEYVSAHDLLLARLQTVAEKALNQFDVPGNATAKLINVSENATYKIEAPGGGERWALRVHRDGYHSKTAIASELAWQIALRKDGAANTPVPIPGRDGELIQTIAAEGLDNPRNVVLYKWEAGHEPASTDTAGFELLGETAARMHEHVLKWQKPAWFTRHSWDFETSLGSRPHWGRWRDGLGMTSEIATVVARTVGLIEKRLASIGMERDQFNLVHGDMRLANLLMDGRTVKVIDFDDCGFSWLLYDCATTVSFFEHDSQVPELIAAWVKGYRKIRPLSQEQEREIETFVMLRRILLVAWIGSHSETDLAKSMGVAYTQGTVPLCERYLSRFESAV